MARGRPAIHLDPPVTVCGDWRSYDARPGLKVCGQCDTAVSQARAIMCQSKFCKVKDVWPRPVAIRVVTNMDRVQPRALPTKAPEGVPTVVLGMAMLLEAEGWREIMAGTYRKKGRAESRLRQAAIFVGRARDYSFRDIGLGLGLHHTTALDGYRRAIDLYERDEDFKAMCMRIM